MPHAKFFRLSGRSIDTKCGPLFVKTLNPSWSISEPSLRNATAASLADELPPLPPGLYAEGALAYDMMYARAPTRFMRAALADGAARVADGLGMLVEQAAESFTLWRGVRPDSAPVLAELRRQIEAG